MRETGRIPLYTEAERFSISIAIQNPNLTCYEKCLYCRQIVVKNDDKVVK